MARPGSVRCLLGASCPLHLVPTLVLGRMGCCCLLFLFVLVFVCKERGFLSCCEIVVAYRSSIHTCSSSGICFEFTVSYEYEDGGREESILGWFEVLKRWARSTVWEDGQQQSKTQHRRVTSTVVWIGAFSGLGALAKAITSDMVFSCQACRRGRQGKTVSHNPAS